MKLLKLLENIVHERYSGVDIKMFALFADIFSNLVKGLKLGMLDEVYQDLSQKYEGTKKQDLVSETIDDRILKLIGLEDIFDFTYEEYKDLLREKLSESRAGKPLPSEEDQILVGEYKRVKDKVGKFKVKKKMLIESCEEINLFIRGLISNNTILIKF